MRRGQPAPAVDSSYYPAVLQLWCRCEDQSKTPERFQSVREGEFSSAGQFRPTPLSPELSEMSFKKDEELGGMGESS